MAMVMNGFSTSMGLVRQAGRQMQRSTAKEERSSLVQNNEIEKNRKKLKQKLKIQTKLCAFL